jgi:hypothetical protein
MLPDGSQICVYPMTFGKARLSHGEPGPLGCILNAYCYESRARAIEAAEVWTGEGDPLVGWHRHPITGRYRLDGDPATEHFRW